MLEENVGPVPVMIRARDGKPDFAQLSVAMLPEVSEPALSRAQLAEMLSLSEADVLDGDYAPQNVSCGLPFLIGAGARPQGTRAVAAASSITGSARSRARHTA